MLQILQENTCVGVYFQYRCSLKACNFIKKSLRGKYFPVRFAIVCEIFKNIFLEEHLRATASGHRLLKVFFSFLEAEPLAKAPLCVYKCVYHKGFAKCFWIYRDVIHHYISKRLYTTVCTEILAVFSIIWKLKKIKSLPFTSVNNLLLF